MFAQRERQGKPASAARGSLETPFVISVIHKVDNFSLHTGSRRSRLRVARRGRIGGQPMRRGSTLGGVLLQIRCIFQTKISLFNYWLPASRTPSAATKVTRYRNKIVTAAP
jgi:hypothetical protein